MVGSNGARMLELTLPHVDAWNTWYSSYGNTVDGFAELNRRIDAAAARAGRASDEIARSACVLVELDASAVQRPSDAVPPVPLRSLGEHLDELAAAGADEAILILRPITEASIRAVGTSLG
jgi:alkanesulfonate monooxygenase SsuD/methylene tetrahydromethanopterin reductase-like flavin-dependent oxidoreductase (luciferase family)